MSRQDARKRIENEIKRVRDVLETMPENRRLHAIGEALCDLNDSKPEGDRHSQCNFGCYDWDIKIDYRPHHQRYPKVKP